MNINLKGTGIELTPAITEYATTKIASVERYLQNSGAHALVEVGKNSKHHKHGPVFRAEVHITGAGADFYAVSEAEDLYAAIDLVRDEIIHEITHAKDKRLKLLRRGGRMIKGMMRRFF